MSKPKFKIGDRVSYYQSGMRFVGVVYGYRSVPEPSVGVLVDGHDVPNYVHPKQCRLISERTTAGNKVTEETEPKGRLEETELQRLIRRANFGGRAVIKIAKKYPGQVESGIRISPNNYSDVFAREAYIYRIKPEASKPKVETFQPFYIGPLQATLNTGEVRGSWLVTLFDDGQGVKIGCTSFRTKPLIGSLKSLVEAGCGESWSLRATREGVQHANGPAISWADAEKLLAALRKVSK